MLKSEVFDPKLEGSLVCALIGNTLESSCFQQAELNASTQLLLSRLIMYSRSHLESLTSSTHIDCGSSSIIYVVL